MDFKEMKEIWAELDTGEKWGSVVQVIAMVAFTAWIFIAHTLVASILYGSVALFCYIMHSRDVYYAYGQCVVNHYHRDARFVIPKHGGLKILFPSGSTEYYCGSFSNGVVKLLKKAHIEIEDNRV